MSRCILFVLALAALSGCAGHAVSECRGPLFPLNAGQWQPTPQELKN